MEAEKHWIALNMVQGVGKTPFHRLVNSFGSPEAVFKAPVQDIMGVEGNVEKIAGEIKNFKVDTRT